MEAPSEGPRGERSVSGAGEEGEGESDESQHGLRRRHETARLGEKEDYISFLKENNPGYSILGINGIRVTEKRVTEGVRGVNFWLYIEVWLRTISSIIIIIVIKLLYHRSDSFKRWQIKIGRLLPPTSLLPTTDY